MSNENTRHRKGKNMDLAVMTNTPKRKRAIYGLGTAILSMVAPTWAAASGSVTINTNNTNADMDTMMGGIIGVVFTMARYVGVFLLVYGIWMTIQGFKDDTVDGKIKGITMCVIAIALISLKTLVSAALPGVIS